LNLKGKCVAFGVTGGIAVYKACDAVSTLVKAGADVHVVMTENAKEFVSPLTFETLTKNKVISLTFDKDRKWEVEHIALAKKTDVFVVAPCTANVVGKLASGIADDFLTTTLMAFEKPKIIAPAMNTAMYHNPAFIANRKTLSERGYSFVDAVSGRLACGDVGDGKLAETSKIISAIEDALFPKRDLMGKKVVIAVGSTRTYLDPVRFVTNSSSGKMGKALAEEAISRGAEVTLVKGFVSVEMPKEANVVSVKTTIEMCQAVMTEAKDADYLIMAAAPSDYTVEAFEQKIKSTEFEIKFTKTVDIAAEFGKEKGKTKLVVFAAETENLIENARAKMLKKNADMVVANDVTREGAGFNVDTNIVTLITASELSEYSLMTKRKVAEVIFDTAQKIDL